MTDVNPGTVVATLDYWRQLNNSTVNCISSTEFGDRGNSVTFSDNLVEVFMLVEDQNGLMVMKKN